MGKYFNNGTRTISIFIGGFVFFGTWLLTSLLGFTQAILWALLMGALTTLFCSILYPAIFALRDRRYRGIEQTLPLPVLFKANVSVRNENPPRDGYLFITAEAIYLFSRDHKPYVFRELAKEKIRNIRIERGVYLTVMTADEPPHTTVYSFVCGKCREAAEILRRNGWKIEN